MMGTQLQVVHILDHVCTATAFVYLAACILIDTCRVTVTKNRAKRRSRWLAASIWILILSYAGEAVSLFISAVLRDDEHFPSRASLTHVISLALVWTGVRLRNTIWYECLGVCLIVVAFEVPLYALRAPHELGSYPEIGQLLCQSIRLLVTPNVAVWNVYVTFRNRHTRGEESRPFLRGRDRNHPSSVVSYGTEPPLIDSIGEGDDSCHSDDDNDPIKERQRQRLEDAGNWWTYLKGFSILLPYLIPKKDRKVQLCMAITVLCLIANRALNVLIPRQLGIITDKIVSKELPSKELGVWLILRLLSGDSGIGLVERLVRIPITQFSYRQITNAAFNHVMHLSIDFHYDRDSAEVMKAVEQGSALNNLLEAALTEVAPPTFDLLIAYVYLYQKFNSYALLVILVSSITYLYAEVTTSTWNVGNRRRKTKAQREEAKVMHQAVQGWETVSYFNRFGYEKHRFGEAIEAQLAASRDWNKLDAYTTALTESLIPVTFFCLSSLVLYQISHGHATPGDFVFLIQYWETLIYPIMYLSSQYRWLVSDLVDAERLLVLFQTKPLVTDKEGSMRLSDVKGNVSFKEVSFSYDPRKPTLQSINFEAKVGETVALVGVTGAGKSSILKLLFRFYDVSAGRIEIDGHDIRDVRIDSLRDVLGVVPQEPLLFNSTIMDNLRYAKLDATEEEIYEACKNAAIHDTIMAFPDKYQTSVGEQGLKLSGGELQRVAIARVFLKNPPIFILDEATSAVDANTESEIQEAFHRLSTGRTTFVIAHRLSTVTTADRILVVHDGRIVESGTHQELLRLDGRYASLWAKQFGGILV